MKFETRKIEIYARKPSADPYTNKPEAFELREIEAEVYGFLAFHPRFLAEYERYSRFLKYSITHVPTGGLLTYTSSKAKARKAIRALAKVDVDWENMTIEDREKPEIWVKIIPVVLDLDSQGLIVLHGRNQLEVYLEKHT